MYKFYIIPLISILLFSHIGYAQDNNVWKLQNCIQYAKDNNLSIKESELNERLAKLTLLQANLSQIPNVNGAASYGQSYGTTIDPTTLYPITQNYNYLSLIGNADVLIFGWFQKRNLISADRLYLDASKEDLNQMKNDVVLNVATGYFRALLAKEQIVVSEKQLELTRIELGQTRQQSRAGTLPDIGIALLESQLATDSSIYIMSVSNYNASILDLKALLNLSMATPFDIVTPDISMADQINVAGLTPESVYTEASHNLGSVRSSELRLAAAQKNFAAAKAALLPSLNLQARQAQYIPIYRKTTRRQVQVVM